MPIRFPTLRRFCPQRFIVGTIALGIAALSSPAAPASRPLRPLASNPRYFTDGSGRAIFLTGSHTWANFATDQGNVKFDYDGYLDFLEAHHLNFFRGWMWDLAWSRQGFNGGPFQWHNFPWERTGPGIATDGLPKFDLSKFDQSYFDRVRARIIQARDRGIYVSVMLFQGYAWQFDRNESDGFAYDGRNNVNGIDAGDRDDAATLKNPAVTAAQEAYVRKVIDTVNDLDNVLYEISNESAPASNPWQYHMIDFIHVCEKTKPFQHPVGMTYQYDGGTNDDLYASPADWISPNNFPELVIEPPASDGSKVIIFDTDHGYGWQDLRRDGPALQQEWAWKNFCRGNNTLFMDPYLAKSAAGGGKRNHPVGSNPDEPYFGIAPDPYWEPLRRALGDTRLLSLRIDLAPMTPHGEFASTGFCLAAPGKEYVVFCPALLRSFSVDLMAGDYAFEWIEVSSGVTKKSGTAHFDAGVASHAPPFDGAAVLYLKRKQEKQD